MTTLRPADNPTMNNGDPMAKSIRPVECACNYRSSCKAALGRLLACVSICVPDCTRIW